MTPTQIIALRAKIFLDATATAFFPLRDSAGLQAYLNGPAVPGYTVYANSTPADDINDAILWAKLIPVDTPNTLVTFTNQVLVCQMKQMQLEIQLVAKQTVNTGKASVRGAFQSALTNVPSDVAGAVQSAGWPAVKTVMSRAALVAEKMMATGAGTAASPSALDLDGAVSEHEAGTLMFHDNGVLWTAAG